MKNKTFIAIAAAIVGVLLAVVLLYGQPSQTGTQFPMDTKSRSAAVLYAWNGTEYKQVGQTGAIFDNMSIYLDDAATTSYEFLDVSTGRAGFVFYNHSSNALACSTSAMTRAMYIPAATSVFIPLVASRVYYKRVTVVPEIEIQAGGVN